MLACCHLDESKSATVLETRFRGRRTRGTRGVAGADIAAPVGPAARTDPRQLRLQVEAHEVHLPPRHNHRQEVRPIRLPLRSRRRLRPPPRPQLRPRIARPVVKLHRPEAAAVAVLGHQILVLRCQIQPLPPPLDLREPPIDLRRACRSLTDSFSPARRRLDCSAPCPQNTRAIVAGPQDHARLRAHDVAPFVALAAREDCIHKLAGTFAPQREEA